MAIAISDALKDQILDGILNAPADITIRRNLT